MSDKYRVNVPSVYARKTAAKHQPSNTADKAVEGIVDVTKIATTGIVAVGVLGAVGSAFKK